MRNNHIIPIRSLFSAIIFILSMPCDASNYDDGFDSSGGWSAKRIRLFDSQEIFLKDILANKGESPFYDRLAQGIRKANDLELLKIVRMHNKVRFRKKINPYKILKISGRRPFQVFMCAWSARVQDIMVEASGNFLHQLPKIYHSLRISPTPDLISEWEKRSSNGLKIEKTLESMRYWINSRAKFSNNFLQRIIFAAENNLDQLSIDALGHYLHLYNWYEVRPSINLMMQLNTKINSSENRRTASYENTFNTLEYTYLYWPETRFNEYIVQTIHMRQKKSEKTKTTISQFQQDVANYISRFNKNISMEPYVPTIGRKVDIMDQYKNIVEVDGLAHFMRYIGPNNPCLLYNSRSELTTQLMKRKGYSVYRISRADWDENKAHAFHLF